MADTKDQTKPVIVVGAGPVGLVTAIQLHRHGVPVRVVEKEASRSKTSKALGVHSRTLEIFEGIGILEDFLKVGRPAYGVNVYYDGNRIVHLTLDELNCPYPFVLVIPQSQTERILEEFALGLGIKIERQLELLGLEQDDALVRASLRHVDGREEVAEAHWLVACDGAHSTVRKECGIPFEGAAYEELFAAADVAVDCELPEDEMHVFLNEDGVMAGFPFGNKRYRFVIDVSEDVKGDEPPSLEQIQEYVNKRSHVEMKLSKPEWLTWFRIHRRMVPRYYQGRVFLAGDAAHIHSPLGGQGMNTGIQDANNLAWKLALVIKNAADRSLLETYQLERHAVASAVLTGTDLGTKMATLRNPVAQKVRNKLAGFLTSLEVIQHRMQKTVSMMLVNYRKSPIVAEFRSAPAVIFGKNDPENPDFSDWLDFGRGPLPGDRAPDTTFLSVEGANPVRLFSVIRDPRHSLLIFDGKPTPGGYKDLEAIVDFVKAKYGNYINPHVILAAAAHPENLSFDCQTWHDADISAHRTYGAASECLYLIRPDGYVAFRSQPADLEALQTYLGRVFKMPVAAE